MLNPSLAAAMLALLCVVQTRGESHSAFPVDVTAGPQPQPFLADGRTRLVYELHLTNFAPRPIELLSLEVFGEDGRSPLASYRGEALDKLVSPVENLLGIGELTYSEGKPRSIGEGHSVVIFLELTLDDGTRPPAELRHRLTLSIAGKDGAPIQKTVNAPVVAVVQERALVLLPPVAAANWAAGNAYSSLDHRRAFAAVDGRVRIAQRFAIDWVRLGPDGRAFHGDSKSNANFYGYGSEVLAVADGQVSDLKDGLEENAGSNERSGRSITLDNIVGNYLILDLGHRHFALYAHLQPGRFRVKVGDQVGVGQVLGLLGNSGNSDAPHLHFQLMDANSALGAEGLPYELQSFTQLGIADLSAILDKGQPWQPKPEEKPIVRRREFPVDNTVLSFPNDDSPAGPLGQN